jgi:hypothetical protein
LNNDNNNNNSSYDGLHDNAHNFGQKMNYLNQSPSQTRPRVNSTIYTGTSHFPNPPLTARGVRSPSSFKNALGELGGGGTPGSAEGGHQTAEKSDKMSEKK